MSKIIGKAFAERERKLKLEDPVRIARKLRAADLLPFVNHYPWTAQTIADEYVELQKEFAASRKKLQGQFRSMAIGLDERKVLQKAISDHVSLTEKMGYFGAKLESLVADNASHGSKFGNDKRNSVKDLRASILARFISKAKLTGSTAYHLAMHFSHEAEDALSQGDPTFTGWHDDKTLQRALSNAYRLLRSKCIQKYFDAHRLWDTAPETIAAQHYLKICESIVKNGMKAPQKGAQFLKDLEVTFETKQGK